MPSNRRLKNIEPPEETPIMIDGGENNVGRDKRLSLYMDEAILTALTEQVVLDDANKNSWIVGMLQLLLTTESGKKLRMAARRDGKTLQESLKDFLSLFDRSVPLERITELAHASQRNTTQMMVYLLLLGLKTYEGGSGEPRL